MEVQDAIEWGDDFDFGKSWGGATDGGGGGGEGSGGGDEDDTATTSNTQTKASRKKRALESKVRHEEDLVPYPDP